ncbi:hypothetical protein [Eubacterium maltosivorans]|uniref:Uncharacterized protein n=1 Tax=Eubacterium maltosivorans TaxID=2041044 RepID=A0A4P9C6Y6_EUBML|nr:hypothetical protein [Eubacterium maltosivorans]QCT71104.1 hypothetical protein CPZ25_007120 [Eubacterium maltosivorans]
MTKEQEAVLKRALDHYGIDNQLTKAVEEMAELTKEICKLKIAGQNLNGADLIRAKQHILEEKADVYIMLMQLDLYFGESLAYIDAKIARLKERMDESKD